VREESTRHFGDQYRLTAVTKKLNMPILQKNAAEKRGGSKFRRKLAERHCRFEAGA